MATIAMLLAAAAVAHGFANLLRLPAIPFLLLSGVLLANAGLVDSLELQDPLTLGIMFLLFVGGTELNPSRVGPQRKLALRVGIAQFFLLGAAGYATAVALGFETGTALYLALALTASSTLVVVRLLQRRRQLFEPLGRLVLGVLLLQDLLVILLIPVISQADAGISAIVLELLATLAVMAMAFAFARWGTRWLLSLRDDEETLLLVTLALLFVFLAVSVWIDAPLVSAAFLAGVALSAFPISGIARGQLRSITDFFAAITFTALGGLLVLPGIRELALALVFALVLISLTTPFVVFIAERAGFSARPAVEAGLLLSQTSEFSLVIALQGVIAGQLGADAFTIVVLVTVGTMLLTPVLSSGRLTRLILAYHPLRRDTHVRASPRDHVVLLGCGEAGMPLLETLLYSGMEVVVVDDDPAVITRLREGDVPSIRGDALDPDVLRDAGVAQARIVTSTVRRPRDNRLVLETVNDVPVLIRVFDDEDAEWVASMGGQPVLSSAAAAKAFLRWFDGHRDALEPAAPQ